MIHILDQSTTENIFSYMIVDDSIFDYKAHVLNSEIKGINEVIDWIKEHFKKENYIIEYYHSSDNWPRIKFFNVNDEVAFKLRWL